MTSYEQHNHMIQSFRKALKKALPDGVELVERSEFYSGGENDSEPRYLISVKGRYQVYRDWYEKNLKKEIVNKKHE